MKVLAGQNAFGTFCIHEIPCGTRVWQPIAVDLFYKSAVGGICSDFDGKQIFAVFSLQPPVAPIRLPIRLYPHR
jgi:hypothetical protein